MFTQASGCPKHRVGGNPLLRVPSTPAPLPLAVSRPSARGTPWRVTSFKATWHGFSNADMRTRLTLLFPLLRQPGQRFLSASQPPPEEEKPPCSFYLYKCAWWGLIETSSGCFYLRLVRGAEGAAEFDRKWHLGLFALLLLSWLPLFHFLSFFFGTKLDFC